MFDEINEEIDQMKSEKAKNAITNFLNNSIGNKAFVYAFIFAISMIPILNILFLFGLITIAYRDMKSLKE